MAGVQAAQLIMATFTVTQEQRDRHYSYALTKLLGQKDDSPVRTLTTPNRDADGEFDGTYTVTIPDGRASNDAVRELLDNKNPEQPPVVPTRLVGLHPLFTDGTATLPEVIEYITLRDGLT